MTVTVTTATLLTLLWHFAISLTSGILPLNSGILPFVSPLAFCHSSGELCLMLMFRLWPVKMRKALRRALLLDRSQAASRCR